MTGLLTTSMNYGTSLLPIVDSSIRCLSLPEVHDTQSIFLGTVFLDRSPEHYTSAPNSVAFLIASSASVLGG